jgi:hypothetical protein
MDATSDPEAKLDLINFPDTLLLNTEEEAQLYESKDFRSYVAKLEELVQSLSQNESTEVVTAQIGTGIVKVANAWSRFCVTSIRNTTQPIFTSALSIASIFAVTSTSQRKLLSSSLEAILLFLSPNISSTPGETTLVQSAEDFAIQLACSASCSTLTRCSVLTRNKERPLATLAMQVLRRLVALCVEMGEFKGAETNLSELAPSLLTVISQPSDKSVALVTSATATINLLVLAKQDQLCTPLKTARQHLLANKVVERLCEVAFLYARADPKEGSSRVELSECCALALGVVSVCIRGQQARTCRFNYYYSYY